MQQAPTKQTSTPELAAYQLASWQRAPGAWETAGSILTDWQHQEERNRTRRILLTTGHRKQIARHGPRHV